MNIKSLFGENASYVAAFLVLIGIASATPSIVSTFTSPTVSVESVNAAAAINSVFSSKKGPVNFPAGYTCTPNPVPVNGVAAKTTGKSRLALTYDSNKKEALLTATFNVTIDGGKTGVYISQYPWFNLRDSNGGYASMYGKISADSKVETKTSIYGETFYWVPANRQAKFTAIGTANPTQLFAGTYSAMIGGLVGYPVTDYSQPGYMINLSSDQTNSVTIVGEVTPYITNISPYQANVGDKVTITGQRLGGSLIYADGVALSTQGGGITGSIDGTSMTFIVPSGLSSGWHYVSVSNTLGMSNTVGLEILVPVSVASVIASLDPASPITGTVQISSTDVTANVALAVFDLKSQNGPTTLTSFSVNMIESNPNAKGGGTISDLFTNVMIKVAGQTYAETSMSGNTITFSNILVPLATNVSVPVVVLGSVAANTNNFLNGSTASVNLPLTGIQAIDGNYATVPVSQGSVVGLLSGSTLTFSGSSMTVSNTSTIPSTRTVSQSGTTTQIVSMNFSVTAGNDPVFISKAIDTALTPAITMSANPFIVINPATITSDNTSGDGSTYFYVAPGQTKNFTANYKAIGMPGSLGTVNISSLNYGTSATSLSSLIYKDQYDGGALGKLKFTFTF
ncbi:MAG: hypothetical protein V4524_01995 [Patescibacteria group bacterium]